MLLGFLLGGIPPGFHLLGRVSLGLDARRGSRLRQCLARLPLARLPLPRWGSPSAGSLSASMLAGFHFPAGFSPVGGSTLVGHVNSLRQALAAINLARTIKAASMGFATFRFDQAGSLWGSGSRGHAQSPKWTRRRVLALGHALHVYVACHLQSPLAGPWARSTLQGRSSGVCRFKDSHLDQGGIRHVPFCSKPVWGVPAVGKDDHLDQARRRQSPLATINLCGVRSGQG